MKTLALTLIARNEERCIERCLASARPWVDRMLVLDTGSTDRTIELARAAGAEVFERRWTDDFSAARNAVLTRSDCDFNLVLDADEWIEHGGEEIAAVRASKAPAVYMLNIRSALGAQDQGTETYARLPRLLPRGVRYRGRIHEQPHHKIPIRGTSVVIGHDGYLRDQLLAKRGRNRELLLRSLAETPGNPYVLYQLGKDDDVYGDPAGALEYYRQAHAASSGNAAWRHDLIMRTLACLTRTGEIDKAMLFAADEMAHWQHSADYHYLLGDILFEQFQRQPNQGADLLPMIEHSFNMALKIGDKPDLSGTMTGRGSFMAAEKLWVFHQAQRHTEEAAHFEVLAQDLRQAQASGGAGNQADPASVEQAMHQEVL